MKGKFWVIEGLDGCNALPVPDRTLFLSVPLEFIKKNLSETRTGDDRDYLSGRGYTQKIHLLAGKCL